MEQRRVNGVKIQISPDLIERRSRLEGVYFSLSLSVFSFSAIGSELWIFIIPAVMTLVILVLFLEEMGFFFRNIRSDKRRRLNLWILGIYPVFAITSLVGMYIPRSASLCSFVASIYHSITLWKFLGLITDFFGGKMRMLEQLAGEEVSPSPFPCCCCCCLPMISVNQSNLRWMTAAVFQLSVVRTILFFVMLVLWTDEKYDYGDVDFLNPNSYVNIIIGVSTFLSFYGYLLFYKATKNSLQGYGLQEKFICIIVVLVLFGLQSGILETMSALGAIPCFPPFSVDMRSQIIFHYAVIVEMFFISMLARYCFRKVEPCNNLADDQPRPKSHKSVQTDEAEFNSNDCGFVDPEEFALGLSPGYNSDTEDTLCRIEHAPLDRFDFKTAKKLLADSRFVSVHLNEQKDTREPSTICNVSPVQDSVSVEMDTVQVRAQINYRDPSKDVTMV
ncbi:organic solute transporter subunit alpha-like [Heptranchias perlo]|uniref:organic solute transporter subunit alpha-like n=1 Tax=Heptranchias perlo TaxID=212740 RepID=UPI003559DACC